MDVKTNNFPRARRIPQVFNEHGMARTDNYYWLRDRENPEVTEYLKAENAYAEAGLAEVKEFRENLFDEIKRRIKQTDMSVPYAFNGYFYYSRYEESKEYPLHCRKAISTEREEIILDENKRAVKFSFYQTGGKDISPDNHILAFGEDTLSRRIFTIRFMDLRRGKLLDDELSGTTGSIAWSVDGSTVFYTRKDAETLRPFQVYRHILGTAQDEDQLVFEEQDETFYTFAHLSKSREYVIISSMSTMTSEHRILKADDPKGEFRVFHPRERGLEYDIAHLDDHFLVLHNGDAQNFKVSKTPVYSTGRENWTDFIAHRSEVLIEDIEVFLNFIVVDERQNGLTRLRIISRRDPNTDWYVDFEDPAYMAYLSVNKEFDTDILRYGYTSLTTPNSVYDINMNDRAKTLMKREEVLGAFDPEDYVSERLFAKAKDGTEVPVSIVYKKGFEKNGNAPVLLYAYGSYGHSMDAYFSSPRLSLLDRGFAFAIAHIRGGEEMGRKWYEEGKLKYKMNTFTDFIDVARFLIEQNYTSTAHLYAMGGSAGGLLMGVVVNLNPELWNGIVAQVPFVDVITTMLDPSIPLTTGEYDEWGDPNVEEDYRYIMQYSPYDNVKEQNYPAMLVTTGLHDSQVQYWEPAKWVAKLREMKTNDEPLYLVTNLETGHGGASGRFEKYKEVALEYAFLLQLEGIEE